MVKHRNKWHTIWNLPRLVSKSWALFKNPHISRERKLLVLLLGLGYLVWPLDLIPVIPLLGQIDDLGVIFFLLNWFVNKSEPEAIEAEYYFADEKEPKGK
ncbi:MAG: DUF1232 domain-containing protein [Bacillota bacterium]|uniref:DUF1232 domain-containing protein n=1 Tax=Thermanaerosceptrum fracticalcis TaxID=1712410 RepID=A0A7G6E0Q7_THEFR|nr:YkvA family protein [Thermanaerosceptrum fracticalcis]QNB45661.1 DUF1232 domain-containing protein [Thermanaerosceptrum fracticalcis]